MSEAKQAAERARAAAPILAGTTRAERDGALKAMAAALREHAEAIIAANEQDMDAARKANTENSLLDRLMLDGARVEDMACALEDLAALPDPLGVVQEERTLYNGIELKRVSVPLGVVAMVYEARPNVTADAAGICLKSGNACVLRGGSLAIKTNIAVARVLHDAGVAAGMPADWMVLIASTDRAETDALMALHGLVDVLIPRGGAGLIRHCVECSKVPVIETGTGNCHVYVQATADLQMAKEIVLNAKCRRYGVCNACETLLVDRCIASTFLPELFIELARKGVKLHCDPQAYGCAVRTKEAQARALGSTPLLYNRASEADWDTEYLAPELAIRCVSDVDEAIEHINAHGTRHSEAIVVDVETEEGAAAAEEFTSRIDAAAVYVNASTSFTDGGQFGLGAEIGISTQKLHVRGPFALQALTSYKYILRGSGQVRA